MPFYTKKQKKILIMQQNVFYGTITALLLMLADEKPDIYALFIKKISDKNTMTKHCHKLV